MAVGPILVIAIVCLSTAEALDQQDNAALAANPIRKVVTMLEAMAKKVTSEGEKEKEIYAKFECYCRNGAGELSKSVSEGENKVPLVGSDIKEAEAKKTQTEEDLKNHKQDRAAAKSAMATAGFLREKAAVEFAGQKAEYAANVDALGKAIKAVSKGVSGSFLQTEAAQVLKKLVLGQDMLEADRQDVMAFLSGSEEGRYVPQSGEIVGVLKNLQDIMSSHLAEISAAEAAAIVSHDQLMAAKTKEIRANAQAFETKSVRLGQLSVNIVQMKKNLVDTEAGLAEDRHFLGDMNKNCAAQANEWDERTRTRAEEMQAITETISVLSNDDALEMFKNSLPSASSSFVQVSANQANLRSRALSMIRSTVHVDHRPQFDFIMLAIRGKAAGFEKVVKMIDTMVATLKQEQIDDDHKTKFCAKQLDSSGDQKKGLAKAVSDLEISIDEAEEGAAVIKEEIGKIEDSIKSLDKSVLESTEQRKSEHEDFTSSQASNSAAQELLSFAMNRLRKFYKPGLYQKPTIVFAEIRAHSNDASPATFDAYSKKKDESDGVLGMLQLLVKDLDKEMIEAKTSEKDGQKDYEEMLTDSAQKRALDSATLTDKNIAKASLEADIEASKDAKASTGKELMAADRYMSSLHAECDWLLQYADVRAQARTSEMESLADAKNVLSGMDVSLLQPKSHNLRRR